MIKINETPMAQLKTILEKKNVTPYQMDKMLGKKAGQSYTINCLKHKDMRSGMLQNVLSKLGLTLAILTAEEVELLKKK